jgi:hypothetical protein
MHMSGKQRQQPRLSPPNAANSTANKNDPSDYSAEPGVPEFFLNIKLCSALRTECLFDWNVWVKPD